MQPIMLDKTLFKFLINVIGCKMLLNIRTRVAVRTWLTLPKPKGELAPLARLRITESLSEGDRIGVEILSDPTSII